MRKRLSFVLALALVPVLASSGEASADTTLGSTAQPPGSDPEPCAGVAVAQVASDPSTPYTVPFAGRITAWRVNTVGATPGAPVTLVVLRQVAGPTYTVVGVDSHVLPNPLPGTASFTVASPIGVSGGELLGNYAGGTTFNCFFHHGSTPQTDALIALGSDPGPPPVAGQSLLATLGSGPGFTLNLAATLAPPHKKKCKKKKKKHSVESAKKKKCKKKKKKG
jgi:hypothetical protein